MPEIPLSAKEKKHVLLTLFLTQGFLRQHTPSKWRQMPAENAYTPTIRMRTSSCQETTHCVCAFLSPSGISMIKSLDSALTQAGPSSQRRSDLGFEHRQIE